MEERLELHNFFLLCVRDMIVQDIGTAHIVPYCGLPIEAKNSMTLLDLKQN